MNAPPSHPTTITEQDIVFECPYCGKSMAIDKRGMGLTIECPDCQGLVRVPTVSEKTSHSPDSVHLPVEGLANALDDSRQNVQDLLRQVEELSQRREELETQAIEQDKRLEELRREFATIQSALDRVSLLMLTDSNK
jgi:predicted  nucleic acid-binding Zn-ribbon protein